MQKMLGQGKFLLKPLSVTNTNSVGSWTAAASLVIVAQMACSLSLEVQGSQIYEPSKLRQIQNYFTGHFT